MKRVDVVFCGEKPLGFECLRHLRSLPEVNLVAVCTRAGDKPVWYGHNDVPGFCQEQGIPVVPRAELKGFQYDYLISVLYPFIIDGEDIVRAKKGAFNLHEAPLPRWRGCNGCSHAILAGDPRYATTLHVMDPVLDAGKIVASREFPIDGEETALELYQRTSGESLALFKEWLPRIIAGDFTVSAPAAGEESFLNARNSLIPFKEMPPRLPLCEVYRRSRALDFLPWEPAHARLSGETYYFFIGDSPGRNLPEELPALEFPGEASLLDLEPPADAFRIDGFGRPLVVCREDAYRDRYPLLG